MMDDIFADERVTVSDIDLTEADAEDVKPFVKSIWDIQDMYENELLGLFSALTEGLDVNPDETSEYVRAILSEDVKAKRRLEAIEEKVRERIRRIVWPARGHVIAARNVFLKEFYERYPTPNGRPGDISAILEELI